MIKESNFKIDKQTNFFTGRWFAFRMAVVGVAYVLRTQRSAWIEIVASLVCIAAGWWLNITRLEWALVLLIICLIFALEAMNTAIESVVDLVSLEYHPLAKVAKDTAAAALIFAVIGSLFIAGLIFIPKL